MKKSNNTIMVSNAQREKTADELQEKGTYNILSDALAPLPDAVLAYKMR